MINQISIIVRLISLLRTGQNKQNQFFLIPKYILFLLVITSAAPFG